MLRRRILGLLLGFMLGAMAGNWMLLSNSCCLSISVLIGWQRRGRSGKPCFNLRRWVYTIGIDEPELAVERCRWCRRIFVSSRAASIHEARCRLRQGAKPAFECRKCGRQFAQHFGRAKRLAS